MAEPSNVVYKKHILILSALSIVTILTAVACLMFGSMDIGFADVSNFIFSSAESSVEKVLFDIRLPRVLLAIAVGGGLSISGAVFQAILMNPLAEPYILGISSGGAFGAVLSFLIGFTFWGTTILSFLGALAVILLVFLLGKRFGELEPNILILTGVMIGAFLSAVILVMITMLDESLRSAVFWLMGNLSSARMDTIYFILPISILISIVLSLNSQKYNVLSLGSETANQLGVNSAFVKNLTYILASFLVGILVSVSGVIGFVGLLIPHVCRMIFGVDNRIVVPASFFVGAIYLTITDTIARTIISPAELPVGAITAILGAPIFIYLLKKKFKSISY